jgi:hypothetical protein
MQGFAKVAQDKPEEFNELYTTYEYAANNESYKNYVASLFDTE